MPKVDPLSNRGTSRVFLCIIKRKKNPKGIADFLGIQSPPVIEQLRRLQRIGVIELGQKEGKEQNYEVNWGNFLTLFIDQAMQERRRKRIRKGDIPIGDYVQKNALARDKIRTLKTNPYFKRLVELYLRNVTESKLSNWGTIRDAMDNFEALLKISRAFKRRRKFEDPEKQDFFDKMRLWYNRTLRAETWMDLHLSSAIHETLKEEY